MQYTQRSYGTVKETAFMANGNRVVITLELHQIGNQAPYFAATFKEFYKNAYGRWELGSCGAGVDRYAELFPLYAPVFRWHLTSVDEPLHYAANALYWFKGYKGEGGRFAPKEPSEQCFMYALDTVCYDMIDEEYTRAEVATLSVDEFASWIERRREPLMMAFRGFMISLFGEDATERAFNYTRE
jgi:hypothetical protein